MKTKKSESKSVYFNKKQIEFLQCLKKTKFLHASRGFGKSHVIAPQAIIYVNNLPGGIGLLTCKSIKQAKSKSLRVIKAAWNAMGMIEGVHFSITNSRPDHFAKPISEPESDDCIWFPNGTVIEMVGSTQYDNARGGSYDFMLGDEIAFFPSAFWDEVVVPSRRGNIGRFMISVEEFLKVNGLSMEDFLRYFPKYKYRDVIPNPFHHGICLFTSPPKKAEGKWIYRFEDLAIKKPDDYMWMEATVYDNIDAYGRDTLKTNKDMMSKRAFDLELGGKRSVEAEIRYYFEFDEDKHTYMPTSDYVSTGTKLYRDTSTKGLVNSGKPIDLSFDSSGWFNGCTVSQDSKSDNTIYIHDFLYVKEESNIDYLVDDFCVKYADHDYKFVRIYGDRVGHDRNAFGITIYQAIAKRLKLNGWRCDIKVPKHKKTDSHIIRHKNMNNVFAETHHHLPIIRMHKENCKDLVQAFKLVEVTGDFQKDKTMEKKKHLPQEHAPHGTDMVDYLLHQRYRRLFIAKPAASSSMEYVII